MHFIYDDSARDVDAAWKKLEQCKLWPHVANRHISRTLRRYINTVLLLLLYLHKPAIVIVTSFSLWHLVAPVLIMMSFSLWHHSLVASDLATSNVTDLHT